MKLVAQNSARVWGGNEKSLATLANGLRSRGHEIVLSCSPGVVANRFEDAGFRVTTVRPRGVADVFNAMRFAAWLNHERPDCVLLTSWIPTTLGAWAARIAKVPRTVVRLGIVRDFPKSPLRRYAFDHWIDGMIVNAEEIREHWTNGRRAPASDRIHVVLNGVRPPQLNREVLREKLRGEIRADATTILIGGAGHVFVRKGFDQLLRAFSIAKIPNSELVILGDGDDVPALKQLAEELDISRRVHWLGRRENGAEIIAGYDVFVLTSRNEGMANVMLEAMAAGVPVIAVDVSGVQNALASTPDRPAAGWIVEYSDAKIAGSMQEISAGLRSNSPEVSASVAEAEWRARNWFSVERMVEESEAVLFG